MSTILRNLPYPARRAIAYASMSVLASPTQGRLDMSSDEVSDLFRELFDADSMMELQYLVHDVMLQDGNEVFAILSDFTQETKFALKVFLSGMVNDNAIRMLCMAEILRRIGFAAPATPQPKRQDDEIDMNVFVRIADDGAIREDCDAVFPVHDQNGDGAKDIRCSFDEWERMGECPGVGLIGTIQREKDTPEGKMSYVVTENMIVPVMDWGLECVDIYNYEERRKYNKIITYDRNHERIHALRNTPRKHSTGTRKKLEIERGHKVVHYEAIRQERYENGFLVSGGDVQRLITLEYESNGSIVTMSIHGIMKPRKGKLEYDNGSVLRYRGIKESLLNPDFYFEVETMDNNTIRRISLFQYNVEYRYTR